MIRRSPVGKALRLLEAFPGTAGAAKISSRPCPKQPFEYGEIIMVIAGVVIVSQKEKAQQVLDALEADPRITTYGLHQETDIVAVFEADTVEGLERLSKEVQQRIDGVLGVFPAYVHFEDA